MKQEYDFSKAERGKFYNPDAEFTFPQEHVEFALNEYQAGRVSIARAAELAEMSVREIVREAIKRGIKPRWDEQMIREELGE